MKSQSSGPYPIVITGHPGSACGPEHKLDPVIQGRKLQSPLPLDARIKAGHDEEKYE